MEFKSRYVKVLLVLLVVIPLIISSIAFLRQLPKPAEGPAGEQRFQNYTTLKPNVPKPPKPPIKLEDLMNVTIGYTDRGDVFLRLRSGARYVDGRRLPYYEMSTTSPSTAPPAGAISVTIRRNATASRLIGEALGIPAYVPSFVYFPTNTTYISGEDLKADPMRNLYTDAEGFITYTLYVENFSEISRSPLTVPVSVGRAYIQTHSRMLESIPQSPIAQDVAQTLRLPDNAPIYRQVAVVLAYMYSHVIIDPEANYTNPLDSLAYGKASYSDRISTFVVLLRLVGVPANVAFGFIPEKVGDVYEVKLKDAMLFVEIFDSYSRILFDPRTFTGLLLKLMGKEYPINVYTVEHRERVVSVEGGDEYIYYNGTLIPIFYVNSTDYVNYLNVTAYAEVMGVPLRQCPLNVTRYSITHNKTVKTLGGISDENGYANVSLKITYDEAVGGLSMLAISYNGRLGVAVMFFVVVPTEITPFWNAMYIYGNEGLRSYEEIGRTYFFTSLPLR